MESKKHGVRPCYLACKFRRRRNGGRRRRKQSCSSSTSKKKLCIFDFAIDKISKKPLLHIYYLSFSCDIAYSTSVLECFPSENPWLSCLTTIKISLSLSLSLQLQRLLCQSASLPVCQSARSAMAKSRTVKLRNWNENLISRRISKTDLLICSPRTRDVQYEN